MSISGSDYVKAQRAQKRSREECIKALGGPTNSEARMNMMQWQIDDWFMDEIMRGRALHEVMADMMHLCAMSVATAIYTARRNNLLTTPPSDAVSQMIAVIGAMAVKYERETTSSDPIHIRGGSA